MIRKLLAIALILSSMPLAACGIKRDLRHPDAPPPKKEEIIHQRPMPELDSFVPPPNEPPAAQRRGGISF